MKLLGIDWGQSKVGIAISDKNWSIVTPYKVLSNRKNTYNKIKNIIEDYNIKRAVIGLPLSIYESRIDESWEGFKFFENFKKNSNFPVSWIDERFSSNKAFNKLSNSEMKYSQKRKKIDKASAGVILERFIEKKKNTKNVILAISGNIGTGKSFIAKKLESILDAKIIEADKVSKEVTRQKEEGYRLIIEKFGKKIIAEDGKIDRQKLGEIVFNNQYKLKKLNSILHPIIIEKMLKKIENYTNEVIVLEIPLLVEKKLYYMYDYSLLTKASKDVIIGRVRNRDQVKSEYVNKIMKKQNTSQEKEFMFDYIVNTDNGWKNIKEKVNNIGNHIIDFKKFLNRR